MSKTGGILRGLAAAGAFLGAGSAAAAETPTTPVIPPPGITLQVLGQGQGYDLGKQSAAALERDEIAFADTRGMTLYINRKDQPGKPACVDACLKSWLPLAAAAGIEAAPDPLWSVIDRPDGVRQWAFKGKGLYTYIKDVDPGSVGGNSPARFGARRKNGAGLAVGGGVRGAGAKAASETPLPGEWRVALAYPATDVKVPVGISIKEVADAAALALVDYRGRTLYAFDGDANQDVKICGAACSWRPLAAPQLAEAGGNFSLVVRDDGIKQWAYQDKGLYSYAGDLAPGDANGIGVDPRWHVAAVYSYFTPASVSFHRTLSQGYVLATRQGMTLYRRDGYILQSGGGHSLHRGQPPRPAVGRDIGTNARCTGACAQVWHPFLAPADAKPQGFWNIAVRDDGGRQWTYQGYALWTYDGDKRPGDMNGNDTFDYAFSDEPGAASDASRKLFDFGTPMDGAPAFYWAIAVP